MARAIEKERTMLTAHELAGITAAIAAATETGLLGEIARGPTIERDLQERLGCDALALDRILAILAALGFVERGPNGSARPGVIAREAMASPGGLDALVGLYRNTPSFLARGARIAAMDGGPKTRAAAYATTAGQLGPFFEPAAKALAARLPPAKTILDVGAGSGVWSLAMLEGTEAHVTAFDLPEVLPSFRARAGALGYEARIATIDGEWFGPALAGSFERVILANVLHLEQEERAAELARRAAACATRDVVVVDVLPIGLRGDLAHAVYELHLAMRTGGGRAHAAGRIAAWLTDAGFEADEPFAIDPSMPGLSAMVARPRLREVRASLPRPGGAPA